MMVGFARGHRATARLLLAAVLGGAWLVPSTGRAHPATLTTAEATVEADGRFRLVVQFDTLAFALNDTSARIGNAPMEELLNGPRDTLDAQLAEARERFLHGFRVETDRGPGQVDAIAFPGADKVLAWKATTTPVLPVVLAVGLNGRLPAGAGTVAFRFPDVLAQLVLTVERPGEEPTGEQVEAGAMSSTLPIKIVAQPVPLPEAAPPPPKSGNRQTTSRMSGWVFPTLIGGVVLVVLAWASRRVFPGPR